MIATVDGRVLVRGTDSIVVGLGGLGIKIFVPADLLTTVRPGDEIFLHTYLHVREQELALYGFAGEQDLAMFHLLLGVSGIGPKSALSILSAMPVDALHLAIGQEQPGVLARVPGVGKKTAEKIILELKDKIKISLDKLSRLYTVLVRMRGKYLLSHCHSHNCVTAFLCFRLYSIWGDYSISGALVDRPPNKLDV